MILKTALFPTEILGTRLLKLLNIDNFILKSNTGKETADFLSKELLQK